MESQGIDDGLKCACGLDMEPFDSKYKYLILILTPSWKESDDMSSFPAHFLCIWQQCQILQSFDNLEIFG